MDVTGLLIGVGVGSCVTLIFGIIGVALLIKHFRDKKKAEESQSWASTSGQITESYVRRQDSVDNEGYSTTTYYPEIRYSYEALGREYIGDQVAFGGSVGGTKTRAHDGLANYPVGRNVIVFYEPSRPEEAVLERRLGGGGKVFLFVGGLFLLISIFILCVGGIIALTQFSL